MLILLGALEELCTQLNFAGLTKAAEHNNKICMNSCELKASSTLREFGRRGRGEEVCPPFFSLNKNPAHAHEIFP